MENTIEKQKIVDQFKEIEKDVQAKVLMDDRHARELAHLIENGSEEDHKICAEALVKAAPGVVLDALKSRFLELTDVVVEFKAMAKGL